MSYGFQTIHDRACEGLEGASRESIVDTVFSLLEEPDPEMVRAGVGVLNAPLTGTPEMIVREIWREMLRKAQE